MQIITRISKQLFSFINIILFLFLFLCLYFGKMNLAIGKNRAYQYNTCSDKKISLK